MIHLRRCAATLVELLMVIAITGVLCALLIPAVQQSRESVRVTTCQNNLRQIGVAILDYEAARGQFPMGADGRYEQSLSPTSMFGLSWWADALPFLEQSAVADRLDRQGRNTGWALLNTHNGEVADGFAPDVWFCPSSRIDRFVKSGDFFIAAPSYVGISGATSHDGFQENRVSPCCRSDGEISAGGVLIPNAAVRAGRISDGLAKTLLVGEQSDYAYRPAGQTRRIDGGFALGWLAGSNAPGIPPNYGSRESPAYNIATVRYRLNEKRYELPGIYEDRGANNPLVSPHWQIVNVLLCDGSVQAFVDATEVVALKRLATRDDSEREAN
jgi:type II secretory pathway pseudopilin PulG